MAFSPRQQEWRTRAEEWAHAHPLLSCPRCPGQALWLADEDGGLPLVWHCVACGGERRWQPPTFTIPRYAHLTQQVNLTDIPRRVILGVRTRLAQRTSPVLIAREFRLQRQVVTAIRKAWEQEGSDDNQAVG